MAGKILLFGFTDIAGIGQAQAFQLMMKERQVEVETVSEAYYRTPLARLLTAGRDSGLPAGNAAEKSKPLSARMLVFSGLGQEELEDAIAVASSCGITREDLKAVLTPYNAGWTPEQLNRELIREHQEMKRKTERK